MKKSKANTSDIPDQTQKTGNILNNILLSCLNLNIYREIDSQSYHQKKNTIILVFLFRACFILQGVIRLFSYLQGISFSDILINSYVFVVYRCLQLLLICLQLSFIGFIVYAILKVRITKQFGKILKLLMNSSDLICEFVLNFSGVLLIVNWGENIAFFIFALIMNGFSVLFFNNYIIRKDAFYCSSQAANIVYKYLFVLGYLLNAFLTNYQSFCCSLILQFIIFFFWYLYIGFKLYIYDIPKMCLKIFLSSYTVLVYLVFQTLIQQNISDLQLQISKVFLIFIVIWFFVQMYSNKNPFVSSKITQNQSMKVLDLFLFSSIQTNLNKKDTYSLVSGILQFHQYNQCINLHCYSHLKQIYDSVIQEKISIGNICRFQQIAFKHYIKCLYEQELILKHNNNGNLYVDYAQFLLNQHCNPFSISIFCKKSQQMKISFSSSIKLLQINQINQQNVALLNKNVYLGMKLETIIESQQIFDKIQNQIEQYLYENMQIWDLFKHSEIDLTLLKEKVESCYQIINKLDQNWIQLKEHFKDQKKWLYIYLNYSLFIKNQKVKSKVLQEFQLVENEDSIFEAINIQFATGCNQTDYYNNDLLFHPESLVIQAIYQNQHLIITKTNQYTKKILGYDQSELIGCFISLVLPQNIRQDHDNKFYEWANSGYSINEKSYSAKYTNIVDRHGLEIKVLKFFKMFISLAKGVQYVGLLKTEIKHQQIQWVPQVNFKTAQSRLIRQDNCSRFGGLSNLVHRICDNDSNQLPLKGVQKQWNLISQNNIFMKDETTQPVHQLKQITYIKILIRLFNVLILTTIIISAVTTSQSSGNLVNYSNQYINFMQTYRIPMISGGNYFKNMLNIGNQTKIISQIQTLATQLNQISQLPQTLTTLFDPVINNKRLFAPYSANQINKNLSYNQVELFYLINSCIMTLSTETIQFNSPQFTLFNSYITPGYDNLLNSTKNNFHYSFQNIFLSINNQESIVSIIQAILFVVFILLQSWTISVFFKRLRQLVQIIIDLKNEDLTLIYQYWGQLFLFFQNMKLKQKCLAKKQIMDSNKKRKNQFNLISTTAIETNNQNFMAKKVKTLIHRKQQRRFRFKLVLLIIIAMIVPITIILAIQSKIIIEVNNLIVFQNDGFSFLKYFPTATVVAYGCLQKYYSIQHPSQLTFYPNRYQDVLSAMLLIGEFQYIGEVKDPSSSYYQKQKNYFFGNPCTFNPSVLVGVGINITQCQTIINSSFTQGLAAYMRAGYTLSSQYIFGSSNLTASQLNDFSTSVSVLSGYILDAITTWGTEFNTRVNGYVSFVYMVSVINICLVIILHVILFQWLVFDQMMKEFIFYRRIYSGMMPQYILIKEKVIRQKLVKVGIILS